MERVIAGSANHTYTLHRNNWPLMAHTSGGAQRQGDGKQENFSICLSVAIYSSISSIVRRKNKKENGGGSKENVPRDNTARSVE